MLLEVGPHPADKTPANRAAERPKQVGFRGNVLMEVLPDLYVSCSAPPGRAAAGEDMQPAAGKSWCLGSNSLTQGESVNYCWSVSRPSRLPSAHQMFSATLSLTNDTLPSQRTTFTPPAWSLVAAS